MRHPVLRLIRPSGREAELLLETRVAGLRSDGFQVLLSDLPHDPSWTYAAGSAADRAAGVSAALLEDSSDVVVCTRGGYGASDLLPLLPWAALRRAPAKLVVGFSDVSALHSALYAQLGWPGLHGPMPGTTLWGQELQAVDIQALLRNLRQWVAGGATSGSLPVTAVTQPEPTATCSGRLFGGCFTVLSDLLGTPYLPASLAGHILFFEDTDEHPARLMRAFNQWAQSGALKGVQAIVLGHLRRLGPNIPDCAEFVLQEFARRCRLPVFHTPLFGHTSPNFPIGVGAQATIHAGRFTWQLAKSDAPPSLAKD